MLDTLGMLISLYNNSIRGLSCLLTGLILLSDGLAVGVCCALEPQGLAVCCRMALRGYRVVV